MTEGYWEGVYADLEINCDVDDPKDWTIYISKIGGGTVGKAYTGDWCYLVEDAATNEVIKQGSDLHTGTAKTHRQAARILASFLRELS